MAICLEVILSQSGLGIQCFWEQGQKVHGDKDRWQKVKYSRYFPLEDQRWHKIATISQKNKKIK
jgi:hypothetical protein